MIAQQQTASQVKKGLRKLINPEKAAFLPYFFKTGQGEYGEGDVFLGVIVPNQRRVAKSFKQLPIPELTKLLHSPVHEERLTDIFILVGQFQKASNDPQLQEQLCQYYLI